MLEILISSSVLIVVLALLRLVLRDKISARLQYALWFLVLVRLLMPVSLFHSPVSVAEAAAPAVARVERYSDMVLFMGAVSERPAAAPTATETESAEVIPVWTLRDAAGNIWFAGVAVMAVWFAAVNIRLALRLRKSRRPYAYHSVMPVYVAEGIPSPCLFGLLRPSVYLTEQAASDDAQARQIIAHELTHYRHGDMIWAFLRSVCLVVWWFDPLVWLAGALSRQDCELACDEGTIKALGEDARFDYGRTLVGMAKVGARPSDLLCGATTMTTGKKSLKERVARIANAPKMSMTVAVIVLLIVAVAVGCTYGGAAEAEDKTVEPEIAVESPKVEAASASDAEGLPAAYSLSIFDPDSGEVLTEIASYHGELQDLYALYGALKTLAHPPVESDAFPESERSYIIHFYASNGFTQNDAYTGFQMWEDGTFLIFDEDGSGNAAGVYESREYAARFIDILEEYHSEVREAALTEPEVIGTYDAEYWEEVDRELASFAYPAAIEVYVADGFDVALPEDDIFGPLTLEDYIYSTDSWQFRYTGEQIANDPFATIIVYDADGRELWLMDDADALMIEEADGSITWVTYASDPVDCADMIRHLLPWAKGEYVDPIVRQLEQEEQQRILDELGLYILPEKEPFFVGAYIIEYPTDDNTDHAPSWAADTQTEVFGQCVDFQYGEELHFTELAYTRYYEDAGHTTIANGDVFQKMKEYYDHHLVIPFTDGLTVSGYDAFFYDSISLTWYDTDRELIFRLRDVNVNEDSIGVSVPLNELVALAESVR